MKRDHWAIVFFVMLAIHLLALAMHWTTIIMATKTLLLLVVARYFVASVPADSTLRKLILLALLFSWTGDVLLMFQHQNSLYFLLGLSSFLIAHIFYVFFFHLVRKQENIKSRLWTLLVVTVYYAVLMVILYPGLGEMKLPVRIYGLMISFMLMLALHMLFLSNKTAGRYMVTGAVLFVISDSVLAINKFLRPIPAADLLIMLTYGLAQFFIIYGAARFLNVSVRSGSIKFP